MENSKNEAKLDALLSGAQEPNRIKTAREFMADKKAEECNISSGPFSMASGDMQECVAYEESDCSEESCDDSCDCENSEQSTSSI